jgi:hypothetical protein
MLEVLVDGRQSEEFRDTSKSRYLVSVRSSMLESVVSSIILPFDNAGELVGKSGGEMIFSPAHLDIGRRIGDGVLPVRSMVSTTWICHENTPVLR